MGWAASNFDALLGMLLLLAVVMQIGPNALVQKKQAHLA
jgi:hypothetical protein